MKSLPLAFTFFVVYYVLWLLISPFKMWLILWRKQGQKAKLSNLYVA